MCNIRDEKDELFDLESDGNLNPDFNIKRREMSEPTL